VSVRIVALLATVVVLAGCSSSPRGTAEPGANIPDGNTSRVINVGGLDRTYRVHKPAGLPASAPLVVMLHGGFGSGEQAERAYGWDQLADTAKFVVAYPDGIARAWNVNGCCGRPGRDGIDDVGFITAMIDQISSGAGIDRSRIYATGISNGGMMSYTLACNTNVLAAIGPDSATQLDPCRTPHPTSVMHIHGTADRLIRPARAAQAPGSLTSTGRRCPTSTRSGATSTSAARPSSRRADPSPPRPPAAPMAAASP
jgi:polyhydroxybutyrate depolymerase